MVQKGSGRIALRPLGLVDPVAILRLSGALKQDPLIDLWLKDPSIPLRSLAQVWFLAMRQCGSDVRELMHDGCPVACVDDAPFGYVNTFKSHVNIGFFYGARLADPAGLLGGDGKRMRHVKLKPGLEIDSSALQGLISAAYVDIRQRLREAPASN